MTQEEYAMIIKGKKLIILCLLFVIILTACKKGNSNSYYTASQTETTQIEQTNFNDSVTEFPPPRIATKEELTAEDKRFKDLLGSLDHSYLTKVRIDKLDRNTTKNYSFFSEDPKLIMQWIDLLRKMKTSVAQDNYLLGYNGFSLTFYNGENVIPICGMMMQYIYTGTEGTMHVVDNYSELEGEFNELLKQIVPEELLLQ